MTGPPWVEVLWVVWAAALQADSRHCRCVAWRAWVVAWVVAWVAAWVAAWVVAWVAWVA